MKVRDFIKSIYPVVLIMVLVVALISDYPSLPNLFSQEEFSAGLEDILGIGGGSGEETAPSVESTGEPAPTVEGEGGGSIEGMVKDETTISLDFVIEKEINILPSMTVADTLRMIQNEVPGLELIIHPDVQANAPEMIVVRKPLRYLLDAIVTARGFYYDLSGNTLTVSKEKPSTTEMIKYQIKYISVKDAANKIKQIVPDIKVIEDEKNKSLLIETNKPSHKKIDDILKEIDVKEITSVSTKPEDEEMITEIIPIETDNLTVLDEIKATLDPLKSKNGEVTIFKPTKKIIIRDTKAKIEEFKKIIDDLIHGMGKKTAVGEAEQQFVRPLKFVPPGEIKTAIMVYVDNKPEKVIVDERGNKLIIYTTLEKFKEIDKLIEQLDVMEGPIIDRRKTDKPDEVQPILTKFYNIKWKSPADIAKKIKPMLTKNGSLVPDMLTKKLMITDEANNFERIEQAIEGLDVSVGQGDEILRFKNCKIFNLQYATAADEEVIKTRIQTISAAPGVAAATGGAATIGATAYIEEKMTIKGLGTILQEILESFQAQEMGEEEEGGFGGFGGEGKKPKEFGLGFGESGEEEEEERPGRGESSSRQREKGPEIVVSVKGGTKIVINKRTNALIVVSENPADVTFVEEMVKKLDVPIPQVMINTKFVEVNLTSENSFGFAWAAHDYDSTGFLVADPGNVLGLGYFTDWGGGQAMYGQDFDLGNGAKMYLGQFGTDDINAGISALFFDGKATLLSDPNVATQNNETAVLRIGTNIPYISNTIPVTSATGITTLTYSYSYRFVGLEISVTPQINTDRYITMKLHPKLEFRGRPVPLESGVSFDEILTREVITSVLVRDGETVVIAGLVGQESVEGTAKIPFLGDIPFLGILFQRKDFRDRKTELMIFVTPHLMASGPGEGALMP